MPLRPLTVGSRSIGEAEPVFIVAEIGTAHGGDLETAERLIEAAAVAGADCAKFQLVFANEIVHPRTGAVDLPGGSVPLFDRFKELERGPDFYARLKSITESHGLFFLCAAFGLRSAQILRDIGAEAVKIASPELLHLPLLELVASWGVPAFLSTGVSTLGDIETALSLLPQPKALLHCVTAYPAPPRDYNLRVIGNLSSIFGLQVGVSDHSTDPRIVPSLAVLEGARIIEKHLTLSRGGSGLDDPVALPPSHFSSMVEAIRLAESSDPVGLRRELAHRYGEAEVEEICGTGRKALAPSEAANYYTTNRSIIAVRDIPRGAVLATTDVALLRSEHNLHPGLSPRLLQTVLGRRTSRDINDGEGIQWEDLFVE